MTELGQRIQLEAARRGVRLQDGDAEALATQVRRSRLSFEHALDQLDALLADHVAAERAAVAIRDLAQ